jgi:transcriptional regulator with XRE-family HTH domain
MVMADRADRAATGGRPASTNELGEFLRSRRARISAADVGLLPGARRRTPGLRREEVAQLAGIGITWYTWLEQGRRINASAQVLGAVARALRLDVAETEHLFRLAGARLPSREATAVRVPAAVQAVLDALEPMPAYVCNARYDVLAWNPAATWLITDFGAYPPEQRNMLWLTFAAPWFRRHLVNWEQETARMVALLRANAAGHREEPAWAELLERLRAVDPLFGVMWDNHDVAVSAIRMKIIDHPDLGLLRLDATPMMLTEAPDWRLLAYTPADDLTRERLRGVAKIRGPKGAPVLTGVP